MRVLQPLVKPIETVIMGDDLLHADGMPIRLLDRAMRDQGLGKGRKKGLDLGLRAGSALLRWPRATGRRLPLRVGLEGAKCSSTAISSTGWRRTQSSVATICTGLNLPPPTLSGRGGLRYSVPAATLSSPMCSNSSMPISSESD